ncbi:Zinc finger protein [Plakobranchus ocellatus]|uniref:Zinc finger protein n=1 Tax=Plakobranchus ocellatus TaxID=259542 RepID=A0AAV4D234_9GAST|nr:Zinc finger protein [Plakobranchus ocellatus]
MTSLLVHTLTWKDDERTLKELFRRLQRAKCTVRPTKSVLGARTIDFLGHRLDPITYASDHGLGAALMQRGHGKMFFVAYASKKFVIWADQAFSFLYLASPPEDDLRLLGPPSD